MHSLDTEQLLIVLCSLVVLSYLFSIVSRYIRVPSVLLLLFAGIGFRYLADSYKINIEIPPQLVESLGVVGLIMIVLEAGIDLKIERKKMKLIRNSFLSALIIFILSSLLVAGIIYYWLEEEWIKCFIYAIPLSIISSAIVIPSIHALDEVKKEFLVYEASFSDILGIVVFNFFVAGLVMSWQTTGMIAASILLSIILSLALSFVLFLILAKTKLNIKFFLIFSLLVLIYAGGKILHLPSLIIILVFGLMINNWEKIPLQKLLQYFPKTQVEPIRNLLHSITAETSFLIRTFFFLLFGFSIQLNFLNEKDVVLVGSLIVLSMFVIRFLYLRFFLHTNIFPEVFFIPRGLITIVLFYKIPQEMMLTHFNSGILFFVILTSSIIMTVGMLFYKKVQKEVVEEGQFSERSDIL